MLNLSVFTLLILLCGHPAIAFADPIAAPPVAHPERHGIHGMLLFSTGQQLYASHLPMFHRPHDVQVLLQIELVDQHLHQQLLRKLAIEPALWTLSPQPFDLSQLGLSNPLSQFGADVVQGHFERGGAVYVKGQTIKVRQVHWYRPLSLTPAEATSKQHTLRYRLIGNPMSTAASESAADFSSLRFYQLWIDQRPAADQLVSVHSSTALPAEIVLQTNDRAASIEELAEALQLPKNALRQLYLELNELQ